MQRSNSSKTYNADSAVSAVKAFNCSFSTSCILSIKFSDIPSRGLDWTRRKRPPSRHDTTTTADLRSDNNRTAYSIRLTFTHAPLPRTRCVRKVPGFSNPRDSPRVVDGTRRSRSIPLLGDSPLLQERSCKKKAVCEFHFVRRRKSYDGDFSFGNDKNRTRRTMEHGLNNSVPFPFLDCSGAEIRDGRTIPDASKY